MSTGTIHTHHGAHPHTRDAQPHIDALRQAVRAGSLDPGERDRYEQRLGDRARVILRQTAQLVALAHQLVEAETEASRAQAEAAALRAQLRQRSITDRVLDREHELLAVIEGLRRELETVRAARTGRGRRGRRKRWMRRAEVR